MEELVTDVNWLAVIIGAALAYGLGMVWFSPKMFGTKWAEGSGLSPEGPNSPPVAAMTLQAVGTFLLAWVVGVTAKNDALLTIILIVAAMAILSTAGGHFSGKNAYVRRTEAGFTVAMVAIMIIVHAVI